MLVVDVFVVVLLFGCIVFILHGGLKINADSAVDEMRGFLLLLLYLTWRQKQACALYITGCQGFYSALGLRQSRWISVAQPRRHMFHLTTTTTTFF